MDIGRQFCPVLTVHGIQCSQECLELKTLPTDIHNLESRQMCFDSGAFCLITAHVDWVQFLEEHCVSMQLTDSQCIQAEFEQLLVHDISKNQAHGTSTHCSSLAVCGFCLL